MAKKQRIRGINLDFNLLQWINGAHALLVLTWIIQPSQYHESVSSQRVVRGRAKS